MFASWICRFKLTLQLLIYAGWCVFGHAYGLFRVMYGIIFQWTKEEMVTRKLSLDFIGNRIKCGKLAECVAGIDGKSCCIVEAWLF